jgi:hypothetical protein
MELGFGGTHLRWSGERKVEVCENARIIKCTTKDVIKCVWGAS